MTTSWAGIMAGFGRIFSMSVQDVELKNISDPKASDYLQNLFDNEEKIYATSADSDIGYSWDALIHRNEVLEKLAKKVDESTLSDEEKNKFHGQIEARKQKTQEQLALFSKADQEVAIYLQQLVFSELYKKGWAKKIKHGPKDEGIYVGEDVGVQSWRKYQLSDKLADGLTFGDSWFAINRIQYDLLADGSYHVRSNSGNDFPVHGNPSFCFLLAKNSIDAMLVAYLKSDTALKPPIEMTLGFTGVSQDHTNHEFAKDLARRVVYWNFKLGEKNFPLDQNLSQVTCDGVKLQSLLTAQELEKIRQRERLKFYQQKTMDEALGLSTPPKKDNEAEKESKVTLSSPTNNKPTNLSTPYSSATGPGSTRAAKADTPAGFSVHKDEGSGVEVVTDKKP